MRLMIRVKTPKGYAASTEKKLRPFIIGVRKVHHEILTTKDDDQILWIIEASIKDYMRICRNVTLYDKLVGKILASRKVRKIARLSKDQEKELDDMLFKETSVDIISREDQDKIQKIFKKA